MTDRNSSPPARRSAAVHRSRQDQKSSSLCCALLPPETSATQRAQAVAPAPVSSLQSQVQAEAHGKPMYCMIVMHIHS